MHLDKKRGLKFRRWISNQPERAILFFFFFYQIVIIIIKEEKQNLHCFKKNRYKTKL
jgi:hypothetical protein